MTTPDGHVRVLGAADVRRLLPWEDLLRATADALVALAADDAPAGASAQVAVPGSALHLKAGALLDPPVLSVKANLRPDRGGSSGAILVFDHRAQRLEALLASGDLTAMRTAAIAAVAARALLGVDRPRVALVGTGPVAAQTWQALRHVTDPAALRVWSRDPDRAAAFAAGSGSDAQACASVRDAVAGADLVVTCTPSREPLVAGADLADGAVVLAMGADSPGKRELGPGTLDEAAVYVDVLSDALAVGECAHLAAPRDDLALLGGLLSGRPRPADRRLVVVDSVGSAAVDAAATALILRSAAEQGVGAFLDLR